MFQFVLLGSVCGFCLSAFSFSVHADSTDPVSVAEDAVYEEQISCNPKDCISFTLEDLSKEGVRSRLSDFFSQNAGKILIDTSAARRKIDSEDLDDIRIVLEEISKRDGKVAIERLHIAVRSFQLPDPPFLKDLGLVGWNLFKRIYRKVYYRRTSDYHAKVLYHPETANIVLVYFVHRKYGDICNTVFASCNEIEYLDDDTFDLQLSQALRESKEKNLPVKVSFRQTEAVLPEAKIDLEYFKNLNRSARIYKWMAASKEREVKPVIKSRFLPLQAVITAIDYSLSVYDMISALILYLPANERKVEVNYVDSPGGKRLDSVVFLPVESD
ncbi:hypothetical protein EHQ12_02390 [Leptospira gomenensis]|uniref:Uncharacterized protein n=1 Tax=Leptospira gomenensis TaxID=2484974 RepID=A0A5F1YA86_9LEPT|nr:hypothetical protein EHQ17_10455 [Leptospira gomenensis]TGK41986.1 hypothetical protein EHQ07_15095 [Leptospira gomenensis]TGK44227.1 hypothetical protein EHQ12_02390 [Leptospira gomenensis]TGK58005.1 hypothetical protein EHQ13_14675 [Leptospira gomenensis]